jgi:hypothetical protein
MRARVHRSPLPLVTAALACDDDGEEGDEHADDVNRRGDTGRSVSR